MGAIKIELTSEKLMTLQDGDDKHAKECAKRISKILYDYNCCLTLNVTNNIIIKNNESGKVAGF